MMLHAALDDSTNSVSSLVLIGATGGIDDPAERRQRQARDHALADRIEAVGTTAFIDEWLATPLFASLSAEAACRAERLQNRAAGMAASLRNCGTGTQLPLWDRVRSIEIPVLVVAGSTDEKFGALGHRLSQSIGDNAAFVQVPGGHAVHLENPDDTAGAVMDWYRTI